MNNKQYRKIQNKYINLKMSKIYAIVLNIYCQDLNNRTFREVVITSKNHLRWSRLSNGALLLYEYVRALHTAHRKRPAPPSILRRTFPALRFRTENYDDYKQL